MPALIFCVIVLIVENYRSTVQLRTTVYEMTGDMLDWGYIDTCPVDLVLSGHYRGGQLVLPLAGPVCAPYVGFFTEYTRGFYQGEQAACVLSAGPGDPPDQQPA